MPSNRRRNPLYFKTIVTGDLTGFFLEYVIEIEGNVVGEALRIAITECNDRPKLNEPRPFPG